MPRHPKRNRPRKAARSNPVTVAPPPADFLSDPLLNLAFTFARMFIPNFDRFLDQLRREMAASRGPESKWRQVLGLAHMDVTKEQVLTRYKELARERHPDRPSGSHKAFVELAAARDAGLRELP
jgi:hypothetical protein